MKVLVLQNKIVEYRVPVYNKMAESCELTVAYDEADCSKSYCRFSKLKLPYRKLGSLRFYGRSFYRMCRKYDVVMTVTNLRCVDWWLNVFTKRNYKFIPWTIGFQCGYNHPYDVLRKHNVTDWLLYQIFRKSDAIVLYMEKSKEFWKKYPHIQQKSFVANNTVEALHIDFNPMGRKDLIFVGSLYPGKGVDKLLDSYSKVIKLHKSSSCKLHIVGNGSEYENIQEYIKVHSLTDQVIMHGAIYDEKQLSELWCKCLACISPTQAGLSVPKSMGYGVPFVTRRDAITGGELYHISDKENGWLYDKDEELDRILNTAISHPDVMLRMGEKAYNYYWNHATTDMMAQNIMDACQSCYK